MPSLPKERLVPLIVATALLMENLDATVLSTSLPAIARELGESPIALKLALTSYLLAIAVFIPASGWVADRFGARTVFRAAMLVFAAGSIGCGLSIDVPTLVAARVLQGVGGAMMIPVGRLVVLRTVERSQLVNAMAWLTIPALLGPVLGPPVGGFITTFFSWRWIFWINLPIAATGVVLATLFIPNLRAEERLRFDVIGFVLVGPGLAAFLTAATLAGLGLLSPMSVALLAGVGLALLVLYVRHALRHEAPVIDLNLLRIPTFRASITGGFLFRVGVGATPFLLPLMLQTGFGLTAFNSGLLTFTTAIGSMAMKTIAAPILRRFGFRPVLIANAVMSSFFVALPALFAARTPWTLIVAGLGAGGFLRSLQFTSINTVAYADVPPPLLSRATSFATVLQELSGSVGVSVAALALEAVGWARGMDALALPNFPVVFVAIGMLSASSALIFWRLLPVGAGADLVARTATPTSVAGAAAPLPKTPAASPPQA